MNGQLATQGGLLELVESGGIIGWILLGLSIVALTLVLLHAWTIRASRLLPVEQIEALGGALREGDLDKALSICRAESGDALPARVVEHAIRRVQSSPLGGLELYDAAEEAGAEEVARLGRGLEGLSVIAAIAPLLGLLGTVLGMVDAFQAIASQGPQAAPELASSISLALVTTLLGLALAIPCVALHAWFRVRLEAIAADGGRIMEALLAPLAAVEPTDR
ncbi:MAG: MotA/TolQ/ExbB proton channel family protein [Phycisphaerales bacterium]|nr:MotA/TolQ/ExbB proton channel family protein [Phycisphaerales bacterium]